MMGFGPPPHEVYRAEVVPSDDPDVRVTSLTIDNVPVRDVGAVLEAIREAGFTVEINIGSERRDPR